MKDGYIQYRNFLKWSHNFYKAVKIVMLLVEKSKVMLQNYPYVLDITKLTIFL